MPALLLGLLALGACASSPGSPERVATPGATGVAGLVSDRGGHPVEGAYVYAYRSARSGLRGPADFEARTGDDGNYFLDLVEGNYHLVARLRQGRADSGPPRVGDAWAIYQRNPVTVLPQHTSRADFVLQSVNQPLLLGKGGDVDAGTGFRGRVTDAQGAPVAGALVLAYRDSDLRRMPDFVSPATAGDGAFRLAVDGAGRYCLAARTRSRGQPQAGELYGVYRGEDGTACVGLAAGEVKDLGILVVTPYR